MRTLNVSVEISCPDWCEESAQYHADELWQQGGDCLHRAELIARDTTGYAEALMEPRYYEPIDIALYVPTNPEGQLRATSTIIMDGRDMTLSQAGELRDALSSLLELGERYVAGRCERRSTSDGEA